MIPWRKKYQLPWILKFSNFIITPSTKLEEISRSIGYPKEQITYIPNGVDTDSFTNKQADKLPSHTTSPTFICVARFHPVKGIDILLDSFAIISKQHKAKLIIVGDGECEDQLKLQAHKLGISQSVNFAGNFLGGGLFR